MRKIANALYWIFWTVVSLVLLTSIAFRVNAVLAVGMDSQKNTYDFVPPPPPIIDPTDLQGPSFSPPVPPAPVPPQMVQPKVPKPVVPPAAKPKLMPLPKIYIPEKPKTLDI